MIGVPREDFGRRQNAGGVNVLFGGAHGVTSKANQFWTQNTRGIAGSTESGDLFGAAHTSGDFNRDGFADLVVGAPAEAVGKATRAGVVHVLYGSRSGLSARRSQLLAEAGKLPGASERGDRFGSALASGDFNGDRYADLAIGAPGENVGRVRDAGAVTVLYGSRAGLRLDGAQKWNQDSRGVRGRAELTLAPNAAPEIYRTPRVTEKFGHSLAAGDIDGDGYADLAVGVPGESLGREVSAGAVHVLYGSRRALSPKRNQLWTQDSAGIADRAESMPVDIELGARSYGDQFGAALAIGDLNGDRLADLAVSVPYEGLRDCGSALDWSELCYWGRPRPVRVARRHDGCRKHARLRRRASERRFLRLVFLRCCVDDCGSQRRRQW